MLFGHGGSQHKKVADIRSFAKRLADHGWASVAIDGPHHGDRCPEDQRGENPLRGLTGQQLKESQIQAVDEWRATLDAVEALDDVGAGPTGYWGVSMGTIFGVPLCAAEPRITCVVLGLMGVGGGGRTYEEKAKSITIPLQFLLQWQDELMPPDRGIARRSVRFNREDADRQPGRARGRPAARVPDQRRLLPASPYGAVTTSSHHASSSASPTAFSHPIMHIWPTALMCSALSHQSAGRDAARSSASAVTVDRVFL